MELTKLAYVESETLPLQQFLDECEFRFFPEEFLSCTENEKEYLERLRKKIGYLFYLKRPYETRFEGLRITDRRYRNPVIFVPPKTQEEINNIYRNISYLKRKNLGLVDLKRASKYLKLSSQQTRRLINRCGVEFLLSNDIFSPYAESAERPSPLMTGVRTSEKKINLIPTIPYIRWRLGRNEKFIVSCVVDDLRKCVGFFLEFPQFQRRFGRRVFNGYWYKDLAEVIEAYNTARK